VPPPPTVKVNTDGMRAVANRVRTAVQKLEPFSDPIVRSYHLPMTEANFGEFVADVWAQFRSAWLEQGKVIGDAMTEAAQRIDDSADAYDEAEERNAYSFNKARRPI